MTDMLERARAYRINAIEKRHPKATWDHVEEGPGACSCCGKTYDHLFVVYHGNGDRGLQWCAGCYACLHDHRYRYGDTGLQRMFGEKVATQLLAKLEELEEGRDYPDNHRFARVGDFHQEAFYRHRYEGGCCGELDVVVDVEGVKYRMGFNYGH